jgi:biopolymer transport protein ExbD
MPRKRRLNYFTAGELNLTAMIDVAFQLLCFFLIAAHPMDVVTNLTVARPAGDRESGCTVIRVTVFPNGYTVNERSMDAAQMAVSLGKLAALDPNQTVLIQCLNEAPHSRLIEVLDTCAKVKLTNLSVVSSGGG